MQQTVDVKELVGFEINGVSYAVEVDRVQEVLALDRRVTKLPKVHPWVMGVIELRDQVLAVIDLVKALHDTDDCLPYTSTHERYLVVNVGLSKPVVFRVHAMNEINKVTDEHLEDTPDVVQSNYVKCLTNCDGRVTVVLDLDKVVQQIMADNNERAA